MKIHSFCPECGINVKVDEDGCCASCGATATGSALSTIMAKPTDPFKEVDELDVTASRPLKASIWAQRERQVVKVRKTLKGKR